MRIVFTLYAINAAAICFTLTLALMIYDEYSASFEFFVSWIIEYMYIVFGPCMLILCLIGLAKLPQIQSNCTFS